MLSNDQLEAGYVYLQLDAPSQHCRAASRTPGGRSWLGDQHLLILELVDHGEPRHLVADNAFRDVKRGSSHAVFNNIRERGLTGGGAASNDVEAVYLELKVAALAVMAENVD